MKHYFVTGSSKGIGKAITETLLKDNEVSVTGISRTNNLHHARFIHVALDFADIEILLDRIDDVLALPGNYFKEIGLINNAGYLGEIKYLGDARDQDLQKIFNINITAVAILMNAFIRKFRNNPAHKIIINMSSGAGKYPYDGWSGYCTSKAAVDMLSRVFALENKIRNGDFRIISLAPGIIETDMQRQIRKTRKENFSNVQKFLDLKRNNELKSTEETARKIVGFICDIDRQRDVVVDLRE